PSGRRKRYSTTDGRHALEALAHSSPTLAASWGWSARAQPSPSASSAESPASSHQRALTNTQRPAESDMKSPTGVWAARARRTSSPEPSVPNSETGSRARADDADVAWLAIEPMS